MAMKSLPVDRLMQVRELTKGSTATSFHKGLTDAVSSGPGTQQPSAPSAAAGPVQPAVGATLAQNGGLRAAKQPAPVHSSTLHSDPAADDLKRAALHPEQAAAKKSRTS